MNVPRESELSPNPSRDDSKPSTEQCERDVLLLTKLTF